MSSGQEQSGEKTHEPSEKRLEDARRRGDIPRSDEVTVAGVYLGLLLGTIVGGAATWSVGGTALATFLGRADQLSGAVLAPGGGSVLLGGLGAVLAVAAPLFLLPALGAIAGLMAQRAIVFAPEKLLPKLSRLSPLSALKNRFGPTGLMEFLKRLVKMSAVTVLVSVILSAELDAVIGSVRGAPASVVALMLSLVQKLLVGVAILSVAIAGIDLAWVRFDHRRKLKMTLQELRDESKESEGDPMLKAKRRQRATEIATNRMLSDVPRADVVLVNPTHYAVALAWSRKRGSAPRCVAKGTDQIALRIREIASESGVPIQHDPPTARTLHATVEIGDEIPPELYRAVAAAIRFAEDMRRRMRERTGGQP
ncbi:EscU/YscU/HrcU family type III secretion system export apparatus switch protein [Halovulum sp. GXIMD14794]